MKNYLLYIICCLFSISYAWSQDLHSSNYDYNAPYINPAEAGSFLGTARIMGSYRDQYDAFITEGYNRQIAAVDMPLNIRFLKRGWTGYGLSIFNDKAGDLGANNTGITASLSYHLPLDKKSKNVIAFGLQVSRIQRGIGNPENARFGDVLAGGGGTDFNLIDQYSVNSTDYNVGFLYKTLINKQTKMEIGVSAMNLISGNISKNRLLRRFNIYAKVPYLLQKRLVLESRIYTSFASNNFNINPQAIIKYRYKPEVTLGGGIGYRIADALQALITVNYKGWEVGLSYDVTVSGARRYNNAQGAFEIGLKKIFILKDKIKIDPIKVCPRI